jgi:hypothetical protein
MSNESRPTIGPKSLPSEVLKGIVGGTQCNDRQKVDDQTAIGMTAGADEANHGTTPDASSPGNPEGARDAATQVAAPETRAFQDPGVDAKNAKSQIAPLGDDDRETADPVWESHDVKQMADSVGTKESFKPGLEPEQENPDTGEVMNDFKVEVKPALQAAPMDDPRLDAGSGDPNVFKAVPSDLFGEPGTERTGTADQSAVESGAPPHEPVEAPIDAQQQAFDKTDEAQQKPAETPSDDEIADQIKRHVGADQPAAELATTWRDDEQLKYKELIENLWALARAGDAYLMNRVSALVTAHNHYAWQLESDQDARSLAQAVSLAKAYLGDISLAREIVDFKTRDVKQAESDFARAKAAGEADLFLYEGRLSFAKSALQNSESVLNKWIEKREYVLREVARMEREGNAFTVKALANVRDQMEKLYSEHVGAALAERLAVRDQMEKPYSEYTSKLRPDADKVGH